MSARDDGGPAFPMDPQQAHAVAVAASANASDEAERDRLYTIARGQAMSGLSMRDYFAAQAIVECIRVAEHQTTEPGPKLSAVFDKAAGYAYYVADAMLQARQA